MLGVELCTCFTDMFLSVWFCFMKTGNIRCLFYPLNCGNEGESLLTFRVAWCSWLEKWMDYSWSVAEDITLMTLLLLDWLWSR